MGAGQDEAAPALLGKATTEEDGKELGRREVAEGGTGRRSGEREGKTSSRGKRKGIGRDLGCRVGHASVASACTNLLPLPASPGQQRHDHDRDRHPGPGSRVVVARGLRLQCGPSC